MNAVAPGWIETDMTKNLSDAARERMLSAIPLKKPGTAKQVAGVIAFLASEDADYITGQVLQVDGGMLMLSLIHILWAKASETGITHYYDLSGAEITLNPGKTYIGICPSDDWTSVTVS